MIKVSIVVPVYNVEKYIRRCLESVMAQETEKFSIECVIVDDCTPDNSMDVVRSMLAEYKGPILFTLLKHEKNGGLSVSRNTGIDAAQGEFVIFLDSDDYLNPDTLEYMVSEYEKHPEVDFVVGNAFECKSQQNQANIKEPWLVPSGREARYHMLKQNIGHSAWNKLVKRQLILDKHLYFEPGIIYEDIPWTYKVYAVVSSVLVLPKVTYIYEYNSTSIMNGRQKADYTVRCYVAGCNIMMDIPYEPSLYVPQRLYVLGMLLKAVDIGKKNDISDDVKLLLDTARARLMRSVLKDGRLVLAAYFLVMYQPFRQIFRFRTYRRNADRIANMVERMAMVFDRFHK